MRNLRILRNENMLVFMVKGKTINRLYSPHNKNTISSICDELSGSLCDQDLVRDFSGYMYFLSLG